MSEEHNDPVDLSALDPTANPARFDGIVNAIVEASGEELASRRTQHSVIAEVGRWQRPMLAAAALAALLAVVTFLRLPAEDTLAAETTGYEEALGVPTEMAQWMRADELPTAAYALYGMAESR